MDGSIDTKPAPTESPAAQPVAATPTPVMDVRPPTPAASDATPKTAPVDTSTAPHEEPKHDTEADKPETPETDKKAKKDKPAKPQKVKPPRAPRQPGVGMAIFATIVIVLGLAALAVYAYLKSNGIAVL